MYIKTDFRWVGFDLFQTLFRKFGCEIIVMTEVGIIYQETEESYISKCDHLVNEEMRYHDNYLGKRIYRGLFQSSIGKLLNADVNGAMGIMRKVINNDA